MTKEKKIEEIIAEIDLAKKVLNLDTVQFETKDGMKTIHYKGLTPEMIYEMIK